MKKLSIILISLIVPLMLVGCTTGGSSSSSEPGSVSSTTSTTSVIEQKEFSGITFSDKTFQYDKESHSIYCENVPSFASVLYDGNNQTEPGEYVVYAYVRADGYKNLDLSAKMTIVNNSNPPKELTFDNLIFENLTVEYDGNPHTITVQNVPSFAKVVYSNNSKTGVGTYNATATVSAEGYVTETLHATLKITARNFEGITFKDETIPYDGKYHSIYVENAPSFAKVTYSGNDKAEIGTYKVTATIKATGYNTLTLNATMKIVKILPQITSLVDRTLIYDGTEQLVSFTYPDNLPRGTEATFKVDGKSISEKNDVRVKSVGEHTVSVTLTNETYQSSTTTAKIKVVENTIGTVDSSKTALKITNSLKYKTLREEILKGNFTVKEDYYDDKYYPGGAEEHVLGSTKYSYVANKEAFSFYDDFKNREDSSYKLNENAYTHTKVIGDHAFKVEFQDGVLDKNNYCHKYPSNAFDENVVGEIGIRCIAYLQEAENGGFKEGSEGGYNTTYGSFEIDEVNNRFIATAVRHYYHTEFNHDEREVFTIYNIGNTKINMIDEFKADNVAVENFVNYSFKYNGFEYYYSNSAFRATTSFDAITCCFLNEGEYIVPAVLDGVPVTSFTTGYYDKYKNNDCSGYTLKLYCNNQGVYQGQYSDLGSIKDFKNLGLFVDDGGNVLYYGQW